MALLVGRHLNKIDRKGRVSVPKPFRDAFESSGFSGIYVFPSFRYPAIEAGDRRFMERLNSSLESLPIFSDDQEDLASVILENAYELAFDPEGRIVLPKVLVDHAQLGDQALFVGSGPRFQIWQPASYETHRGDAFARARARGATLTLRKDPEDES